MFPIGGATVTPVRRCSLLRLRTGPVVSGNSAVNTRRPSAFLSKSPISDRLSFAYSRLERCLVEMGSRASQGHERAEKPPRERSCTHGQPRSSEVLASVGPTLCISCGPTWRGPCASTSRGRVSRQLHGHVRPRPSVLFEGLGCLPRAYRYRRRTDRLITGNRGVRSLLGGLEGRI